MQLILLKHFAKQLKSFQKKHFSLKESLIFALENFSPTQASSLGQKLYKIRLVPKGMARGKSGAFRVIVLFLQEDGFLIPIIVYAKSQSSNLSQKEINGHLQECLGELRDLH